MIRKILLLLCLLIGTLQPEARAASQNMIDPHAQAMPLTPFLDFLLDESLAMDIDEVAKMQNGWQPYAADKLPRAEGNLWLRFHIAPLAPEARPSTFLLDMGQSVPGTPILYDPIHNELSGASEWRENIPAQRNILLLPEARSEATPCYIRLEGLPGPWFAPVIRTPQNAASNWDSLARFGALLALAVVMLLCILRGLGERGQWRYWTALFVGMALLQGLLGMPYESQHMGIRDMAATLCPGLALMFLPHAGRHQMQAGRYSRSIDIQLFLLSLPGALLALAPLTPGWNWLDRWLDLWPAGTLLCVPTALGAWIMRLPGAGRFLLACVLPPLFVAFALVGMEFGLSAHMLSSCPLWGIALSALLLVTSQSDPSVAISSPERKPTPKKNKEKKKTQTMPTLSLEQEDSIINLERPLSDPNLRIILNENAEFPDTPPQTALPDDIPAPDIQPETAPTAIPARMLTPVASAVMEGEARELAMRKPLDDILREGAALSMCSLPPAAREAATAMTAAARRLASIISNDDLPPDENISEKAQRKGSFNLQHVLRHAHDSVASVAECAGVALSWYMPPNLGQLYKGSPRTLETTLRMLLESSARSTKQGAIKLSARQVPGSADEGHILFTVHDDGGGYPPHERSSVALARAWELAGEYGGYLSVESSPEGTVIAFTAHLTPDEELPAELPRVILASDNETERWQLARILEAIPARVEEAQDASQVMAIQNKQAASILVAQGRMAVPAAGDLVRDFCRVAREKGFGQGYALALTLDDRQWDLLKASGFSHAMLEPADPEVLRRTISSLLQGDKTNPQGDVSESDLFVPEASSLQSPAKKNAHEAPTMLIEQEFGVKATFEGPDWLGATDEQAAEMPSPQPDNVICSNDAHQAKNDTAEKMATSEKDITTAEELPAETGPDENIKESPSDNLKAPLEWGAKSAISGQGQCAVETAQATAPEKSGFEPLSMDDDAHKPLVDFIVGVESMTDNKARKQDNRKDVVNRARESSDKASPGATTTETPRQTEVKAERKTAATRAQPRQKPEAAGDPAINAMLEHLEQAMANANAHYTAGNGTGVAAATANMAEVSERFGLRILTRMAQCVERAARANDMSALKDLLPELGNAVERTRILVMQKQAER